MAIAKTPKTVPAAKPAAIKPAVAKAAKPVAAKPAAVIPPVVKPPAAKPVAAIAAAAKPVEEAVMHSAEIVAEPVAKAAEPVVEAAPKPVKAATVVAKATHDAGESVLQGVTPLIDFSRENAILFIATGNQLALGFHKLSQSLIDWSAESCDKGVAAGQAMLAAKTVEEVIDLSQSLAKDSLEQLLKEGSELSALSSKLIEDAIAPLPGRLVAAVEKLAAHAA